MPCLFATALRSYILFGLIANINKQNGYVVSVRKDNEMSYFLCPTCGSRVSEDAAQCMRCGRLSPYAKLRSMTDNLASAMLPSTNSLVGNRDFLEAWVPALREKRLWEEKEARERQADEEEYRRDPIGYERRKKETEYQEACESFNKYMNQNFSDSKQAIMDFSYLTMIAREFRDLGDYKNSEEYATEAMHRYFEYLEYRRTCIFNYMQSLKKQKARTRKEYESLSNDWKKYASDWEGLARDFKKLEDDIDTTKHISECNHQVSECNFQKDAMSKKASQKQKERAALVAIMRSFQILLLTLPFVYVGTVRHLESEGLDINDEEIRHHETTRLDIDN